jgi:hypothetical protein
MKRSELSDDVKFWIFYGFILLVMVWGMVNYFFEYALQVYLGILILVLMVWVGATCWNMMNVVMPVGSVRTDGVKIP